MKAIENLFRNGPLAFVALEHARNKKQKLPHIQPSEAGKLVARWNSLEAQVREIDERLRALNVFAALNAIDYETRHSNFLAWLFSPGESHGLGGAFLSEFFALLIKKGQAGGISGAQSCAAGATVERERYGRIDLVILNHEKKLVCIVENKIHTGEHTNQLQRYRESIERDFPAYTRLFVFLTLRPELPSDSHYVSLTYSELSDSLGRVTPHSINPQSSLPFLLHQYEEFLSREPEQKPNIFAALQLREIKHSDFHAWLFNPRGAHNLGQRPFTEFLRVVAAANPTFSIPAFTDTELSDIEIRREEYNIDLLIVSERAKFVCAIENKLDAREGRDQLARYKAYVEEWFPEFRHLFVFFTLRGDVPTDPGYTKLGFREYAGALRRLVPCDDSHNWSPRDVMAVLLSDYRRLLNDRLELRMKTRVELAPAVAQMCADLFQIENTAVCGMLALVRRWQESVRDEMEDFLRELIQRVFPNSYRSPQLRPRFRAYMAFVPPEVDAILPVKSSAPKRVFDLMFMSFPFTNPFQNGESLGVTIICTIRQAGPQYSCLQNELYKTAQKSPALFNLANRKDVGKLGNCRILSQTLVTREDFLLLPLDAVKKKLELKLNRFKAHQYSKILGLLKTAVKHSTNSVP